MTLLSDLEKILNNPRFSKEDKKTIERAFHTASLAHQGQLRASGEFYINHPVKAAAFLADLGLDTKTIVASLLHDTVEDTELKSSDIEKEFGKDVAFLVEGVTKLSRLENSGSNLENKIQIESLKKMLFAMAKDIRVIMIKLADRYHNMQTLKYLNENDRRRIAKETLEIYAPIAARLGMGHLKGELEDLAFPHAYPEEYSWLIRKVKEKFQHRTKYIERTKPLIKRMLAEHNIPVIDIHSRAKHHYSLYHKIVRKNMDIDKVLDLVAMRVIVPDIKSCYEALGIIHEKYKPLPGLIKDYIALPKPNGYQSLHTTIFCEKGKVVEVQVRTADMHEHAENGIAAHWAYSESGKKKGAKANQQDIQWVNDLKKFLKGLKTGEALSDIKIDFFNNRIFVFTPKGEIKDLPEGATPVDFAYAIHTDVGNQTRGAKVNGKISALDCELRSGDVVEIIKSKNTKPSLDWLKFVKTAHAKKIITAQFGVQKATRTEEPELIKNDRQIPINTKKSNEPVINGQRGLLYKISKCCKPADNREIKGYITRSRGVSIHTADCKNIKTAQKERLVNVAWEKKN